MPTRCRQYIRSDPPSASPDHSHMLFAVFLLSYSFSVCLLGTRVPMPERNTHATLYSAHKRSCLIAKTTGCAGLRALVITCVHICIFTHIHTRACVMVHARYRALLTHAFVGTQTHRSAYINRMERTHSVSVAPEPHSTDLLDNQPHNPIHSTCSSL